MWVSYDETGNVEREELFSDSLLDSLAEQIVNPPLVRSLFRGVVGGPGVSLEQTGNVEEEEEEGLVDLSEINKIPLPKKKVQPVYPDDALSAKKEGQVIVNIMINEEGGTGSVTHNS